MRLLLTAGPTREPLDPVRYLGNRSSGKMGWALAEAAVEAGHEVVLVAGPVAMPPPEGLAVFAPVETSDEMFDAVHALAPGCALAVLCAAVADFKPVRVEPQKIKKSGRAHLMLELVPTRDILASLAGPARPAGLARVVGFAAETENLLAHARAKLAAKGCDAIVGNDVAAPGLGFGADENELRVLWRGGGEELLPRASKRAIARDLIAILTRG